MAGLAETLARLSRYGRSMGNMMDASAAMMRAHAGASEPPRNDGALIEQASFGANPGNLRMFSHVPEGLPRAAPLVVVLHGCRQAAAAIDTGTGWSDLAGRHGFAVLLPEQRQANNPQACFNWFNPGDILPGTGEAASVQAMIDTMLQTHALDPARVFVTGLSAGGAFANVMLACYPRSFAAGAIIAGLPYGAATTTHAALDLMHRGQQRSDQAWGDLVRQASGHAGPWPRISVWHGLADTIVAPVNGTDIVRQWLDVHGLRYAAMRRETLGDSEHLTWTESGGGQPAVELHTLPRLGHGVPLSAADPNEEHRCGAVGPFILEAGLSSTYLIAQSFGLTRRYRFR